MKKVITAKIKGCGTRSEHNNTKQTEYVMVDIFGEDIKIPITKAMDKACTSSSKLRITIELI